MGNRRFVRTLVHVLVACGLGVVVAAQGQAPRIAVKDALKVTTWNEPQLTNSFVVGPDGTIDFPVLGHVKAAGLTTTEVADAIRKALISGNFMLNPQVQVELDQAKSKHVNVMGEVRVQNAYSFGGSMRVMDALAAAGSTTDAASDTARLCHAMSTPNDAAATSPSPDATDATDAAAVSNDLPSNCEEVDLTEVLKGSTKANVVLEDGDTLYVPKMEPVYVTGYVKAPNAYPVRRGTTVLQVVTLAGGPTSQGKMTGITILRKVPGKKDQEKISVKDPKTAVVQPGDTVNVPRSFFGGGN